MHASKVKVLNLHMMDAEHVCLDNGLSSFLKNVHYIDAIKVDTSIDLVSYVFTEITLSQFQQADLLIMHIHASSSSHQLLHCLNQIEVDKTEREIPTIILLEVDNKQFIEEAYKLGVYDCILVTNQSSYSLQRIMASVKMCQKLVQSQQCYKRLELQFHHIENDLNIAKKLQGQLLPSDILDQHIQIHGLYMPFEYLGGDYYYWQKISDTKYGVILFDVMGHGTATSLICMYIRTILPDLMIATMDPASMISILNQYINELNDQLSTNTFHCTAIYLIIDIQEKTIDYVNAGNPYAAYFGDNDDIEWLNEGCLPLGIFEDIDIKSGHCNYTSEGKLFVFSDGIYELLKQTNLDINYMLNYIRIYGQFGDYGQGLLQKLYRLIEQIKRNDDVSLVYIGFLEYSH